MDPNQQPNQSQAAPLAETRFVPPQTQPFTGDKKGPKVNEFIHLLELNFQFYNVSEVNKLSHFKCRLSSYALEAYQMQCAMDPQSVDTYQTAKNWLESRYKVINQVTLSRNKLLAVRQVKDVTSYVTYFNQLSLAVSNMDAETRKTLFINGLKHDIKKDLIMSRPATLLEAQQLALDLSQIRRELKPSYHQPSQDNRGDPMEIDNITHQKRGKKKPFRGRQKSHGSNFNRTSSNSNGNSSNLSHTTKHQGNNNTGCFICGKNGHRAIHCHFKCKNPRCSRLSNHTDKDCRLKNQSSQNPSNGKARVNMTEADNIPAVNNLSTITAVNAANEENLSVTTQLFLFLGKINGKVVRILIDSGASCNFVNSELVNQLKLNRSRSNTTVRIADDRRTPCLGVSKQISIEFAQFIVDIDATIIKLQREFDVIIGNEFLRRFHATMLYPSGVIKLKAQGKSFTLTCKNTKDLENQIAITNKDKVSENEVPLQVIPSNSKTESSNLTVTPSNLKVTSSNSQVTNAVTLLHITHLEDITKEYEDVFQPLVSLPPKRSIEHHIVLRDDAKLVNKPAYRLTIPEQQELKKQIDKLLSGGFIEPAITPFSSPCFFVKKQNNSLRLVIDYRVVNSFTVKNSAGIPLIEDLLNTLQGARIFSKLDLSSGYYQVWLAEESRHLSAFRCRFGSFQFRVLPMGLINAVETFQRCMETLLRPFLNDFLIVYLDDILVFSRDDKSHASHLAQILNVLRENKFYLNKEKCTFGQSQLGFLGYVVTPHGIKPDPSKLVSIKQLVPPRNVKEIQSFLGLTGFYRKFISNYSDIAIPLTNLLKDDVTWKWTQLEQKSFELLRDSLTKDNILVLPNFAQQFIVFTDASDMSLGGVLTQLYDNFYKPVAFTSKKFSAAEINYSTYEKELLSVIHALKHWRQYLMVSHFLIYTDNFSLTFIGSQKNLNQRLRRWLNLLSDYQFTLIHIKGEKNVVADGLSRLSFTEIRKIESGELADPQKHIDIDQNDVSNNLVSINNMILSYVQVTSNNSPNPLLEFRVTSKKYNDTPKIPQVTLSNLTSVKCIGDELKDGIINAYRREGSYHALKDDAKHRYKLINDLIYDNGKCYIPNDENLKKLILVQNHDAPHRGHPGIQTTIQSISKVFTWFNLYKDVKEYVQSCPTCQFSKQDTTGTKGLLRSICTVPARWHTIQIDYIGPLPLSENHNMVLTVVDKFSKLVILIPTHVNVNAVETAMLLIKHVISVFGLFTEIISDRDVRFTSNVWGELMKNLQVKLKFTTAYHPRSNGGAEAVNKQIGSTLSRYTNEFGSNWSSYLPVIQLAINSRVHASTRLSPYFVQFGRNPNLPVMSIETQQNETATRIMKNIQKAIVVADGNIKKAQIRQAHYYNKGKKEVTFKLGDLVLLSTRNIIFRNDVTARKFQKKYIGPFTIVGRNDDNYILNIPNNLKIFPKFHISLLKKYYVSHFHELPEPEVDTVENEDQVYEVEKILAKRNGRYLVKWRGFGSLENTWEPKANLKGAQKALEEFEQRTA